MAMRTVSIPKRVTLCAIGYNVMVHDDMIMFSEDMRIPHCFTRICFERSCGCWYVRIQSNDDKVMTSHIIEAQRMVDEWFGGNHDFFNGEHKP